MIWSTDIRKKDALMVLHGHQAPVLTVLYSFDSKYLASADQNGVIKIWSMPSGELVRTINAHTELVQDVSFAEDNKTLVSASLDKKVKLWNIETGECLFTQDVGVEVWSVDLTSNAEILVLGCADGSVRFLVEQNSQTGRSTPNSKGAR